METSGSLPGVRERDESNQTAGNVCRRLHWPAPSFDFSQMRVIHVCLLYAGKQVNAAKPGCHSQNAGELECLLYMNTLSES